MIERIRARIDDALHRLENYNFSQMWRPPELLFGPTTPRFTPMEESPAIVDMNLYSSLVRRYATSLYSLEDTVWFSYPDGTIIVVPQRYYPLPKNAWLDPYLIDIPIMLVANSNIESWTNAIDLGGLSQVRAMSESLNEYQDAEPIILLKDLVCYRSFVDEIVVSKISNLRQIQLLYTGIYSNASRVGPIKTTLDPRLLGYPCKSPAIHPGFTWNIKRHGEIGPTNSCYFGSNGIHHWDPSMDTPDFEEFIHWVAEIDLRPDRPGWFGNVEDEVRVLEMLRNL